MAFATASVATLVYGALAEANKLVVERRRIRLRNWPSGLNGYKIALLADFHLRDRYSLDLAKRAIEAALDEQPDFVVLAGDFVGYWKLESVDLLGEALENLLLMDGRVVAVPGNHDYWSGDASLLEPILSQFNIRLLRNEVWKKGPVTWVGVDSANAGKSEPYAPLAEAIVTHADSPVVVVWHEPDLVDSLPIGADLMLSGHSHGGQFTLPWGWTPMHTKNGEKYVRGWFPDAPTPLYVTRGVGTTGPPSRLGCAPEVTILELYSDECETR